MAARVELHDSFVRFIDNNTTTDFHLRWLRPRREQKAVGAADIAELVVDEDTLRIRWRDERRTNQFPLRWLREHARAMGPREAPAAGDDLALVALAAAGMSRGARREACATR